MEYKIVTARDAVSLSDFVNKWLEKGWSLLGSHTVHVLTTNIYTNDTTNCYSQTMIKTNIGEK